MSGVDFEESDEVQDVANELIDKYHPHLRDAKDLIGYYVRYGSSDWAGKAKKCTAFERHVTGYMMFVFVNHEAWTAMKHDQRIALIDHELCHFSRSYHKEINPQTEAWEDVWDAADDPNSWSIREHDVEEFSDVIRRHGLWEQGIESFALAVRQASYQMTFEDVVNQPDRRVVSFSRRGQDEVQEEGWQS